MWIVEALCGACMQALGAAFKKKMLQTAGINNSIGAISFLSAGVCFGVVHYMMTGWVWMPELSGAFWYAMWWSVSLNVLASYFMYKALDVAQFSVLMPFMTLTSLSLIIPPIFILGEIPSAWSICGIVLVVVGALFINEPAYHDVKCANKKGMLYFVVTALCYTITPTTATMAIRESTPIFASAVMHMLIGCGFVVLMISAREVHNVAKIIMGRGEKMLLCMMIVAGVIVFLENGSINLALSSAPVAHVFAIKRTMPLFALAIGALYFREALSFKKMGAIVCMIGGSVIVTMCK